MKRGVPILLYLLIGARCHKLDSTENQMRLNECGKTMLPIPKDPGDFEKGSEIQLRTDEWVVRVANKGGGTASYDSTGTFISQRHIITNSQSILATWFLFNSDGKEFNPDKLCKGDSDPLYLEVPNEYVQQMKITSGFCISDPNCPTTEFKPVKAWFLEFCAPEDHQHKAFKMRVATLVEIEEVPGRKYPCVADNRSVFEPTDVAHMYGLQYSNGTDSDSTLRYRNDTDISIYKEFFTTKKYNAEGDRGGPMLKIVNGSATLMGVGASPGHYDQWHLTYFHRVPWYETILCDLAGICPGDPIVTTVAPKPPVPAAKPIESEPTKPEAEEEPVSSRPSPNGAIGWDGFGWKIISALLFLELVM